MLGNTQLKKARRSHKSRTLQHAFDGHAMAVSHTGCLTAPVKLYAHMLRPDHDLGLRAIL